MQRDRYVDVLRALAIGRVVVYHAFPAAALEVAFPSMGVMFALGGSLMAASVDRSAIGAVRSRLRRLLPALWVMALVLVPLMVLIGWPDRPSWFRLLLWVLPVADPPAAGWAVPAAGVLWYLVTYLWLVLLSPLTLRLYRRFPILTTLVPLAILAVTAAWPVGEGTAVEWVGTNVCTYAACWFLGYAHRDGVLRRIPWGTVLGLALACVGGGLGWALTHPGPQGLNLTSIPLAYAIYSLGFVLVLLRWEPKLAWLSRRRRLDGAVSLVNSRAVTIYLWHNLAIAGALLLGQRLEIWRTGPLEKEIFFAIALVLLFDLVLAVGWVEDLAARRRVRLLPWPARPAARDVTVTAAAQRPRHAAPDPAPTR